MTPKSADDIFHGDCSEHILNPANRREKNSQDERRRSVSREARKESGVWREVRQELRGQERQEVLGEEKDTRKAAHRGEC